MIEWRWGRAPLGVRDQTANDLAHVLDFSRPKNFDVPRFAVLQGPYDGSCAPEEAALHEVLYEVLKDVRGLRAKAAALRFDVEQACRKRRGGCRSGGAGPGASGRG